MRPVGRMTCSTTRPRPSPARTGRASRTCNDLPEPELSNSSKVKAADCRGPRGDRKPNSTRVPLRDADHRGTCPAPEGRETCALVDHDQRVLRQVVDQRRRRAHPGRASGQVARVVLDAVAVTGLAEHLEVEHVRWFEPLGLEQLAARLELRRANSLELRLGSSRPRASSFGAASRSGSSGRSARTELLEDAVAHGVHRDRGNDGDALDLVAEQARCESRIPRRLGKISTTSPRTRNVPRSEVDTSLRS